jgi:hypothetical protein
MNRLLCRLLGHKWDEFHVHEIVCSRCRLCREWTDRDFDDYLAGLSRKANQDGQDREVKSNQQSEQNARQAI